MKEQKKESLLKKLTNNLKNKVINTTTKIGEKLTKSKKKVAIKVAGLALTVALGLSMASCASNMPPVETADPNDTSSPIVDVDESIDMSDDRYPGLTDVDITEDVQDDEMSKYSPLLQSVLKNDHYNSLIAQAKSEAEMGNDDFCQSINFEPIPYGFLEQQGFSKQSILNEDTLTKTTIFKKSSEPNNLYVNVRAEQTGNVSYFTQYCLKYTLSDKEMQDYDMLREGGYIQSVFMLEEISNQKTPQVLSECKINSISQDCLLKSIPQYKIVETLLDDYSIGDVCMMSFNEEEGKAQLMVTSTSSFIGYTSLGKVNTITISNRLLSIKGNKDGIYCGADNLREYAILEENNTTKAEDITLIHSSKNYVNVNVFELS